MWLWSHPLLKEERGVEDCGGLGTELPPRSRSARELKGPPLLGSRRPRGRWVCSASLCLCHREWVEDTQLWIQQVSSAPSTRMDVVHLQEQLDRKLQQRQARETGICPVRRELYSQCFGEWRGVRGGGRGGGDPTHICRPLPFPSSTVPSPERP